MAGPTLDDRYRAAPLTFEASGTQCWPITNGGFADDPDAAQVPITVRSVALIGQAPPGTTAFQLVPAADLAACDVGEELDIRGECDGATLPPVTDTESVACAVNISFDSDDDGLAILRFPVEATCRDVTARPCDKLAGTADAPSPESPVTVRWTVDMYVNACPRTPPEGIGGNCPGGRYGN